MQFSSERKGVRVWNFRMMIRKIWQFLWYQNRNNFEKNEKRKDQAPLTCSSLDIIASYENLPSRSEESGCVKLNVSTHRKWFQGCGMGPWLVLVSPCFRENVVSTCKIGSLLCSLDNLLQENVIVLFFGNQISKWRSFEKRAIFDLLFTFSGHQWKVTKIPLVHSSLTYIHVFCSPYWLFLPYQFWKKYEFIRYSFSLVWVLVLILIHAILEQSINNKMVSKT